jgi:hypothetical protein
MGRDESGRGSSSNSLHSAPKLHRLPRVEACLGHDLQPEFVCLEFLTARVGQFQPELYPNAEQRRDLVGIRHVPDLERRADQLQTELLGRRDAQPFLGMLGLVMPDLVADDGGKLVLVGSDPEHAFEQADLTAGQRESIGLVPCEDDHLPTCRVLTRSRKQTLANHLKRLLQVARLRYRRFGTDALPTFYPQLLNCIIRNELDRKATDLVTTRHQWRGSSAGKQAKYAAAIERRGAGAHGKTHRRTVKRILSTNGRTSIPVAWAISDAWIAPGAFALADCLPGG